jgi:hypothetical protein
MIVTREETLMTRYTSLAFACALLLAAGESVGNATQDASPYTPLAPVETKLQTSLPQPELVATWGCAACTGPELLGSVIDVAVSPEGTVFVLDSFEPAVRRFSVSGESLSFGREGQGPGEFELPNHIGIVGDEAIEVIDLRRRRLTHMDFDGNVVATRPLDAWLSAATYSRADGGWYLAVVDFRRGGSRVFYLADGLEEPQPIGNDDFPLKEDGELSDDSRSRHAPAAVTPLATVKSGTGCGFVTRKALCSGTSLGRSRGSQRRRLSYRAIASGVMPTQRRSLRAAPERLVCRASKFRPRENRSIRSSATSTAARYATTTPADCGCEPDAATRPSRYSTCSTPPARTWARFGSRTTSAATPLPANGS